MFPGDTNKLIDAFLEGRIDAIKTIADWARSVAVHKTWGFETPEDVVQATMLALVQNFRDGRFKEGDLRAYVRRITKNMCISNYRRTKTRGEHVPLEDDDPRSSPFSHTENLERRVLLDEIMVRLSEGCRQIIVFAYLQGYSRREIGKRLGISEAAARVKLCRCIENARALMEGHARPKTDHA